MPDWRDEVLSALDFWIAAEGGVSGTERPTRVGRARATSEPAWYEVDLRSANLDTDQVESFQLSGEGGPRAGPSYAVKEAVQDGAVVRVRVAEFVSLPEAYLWQRKQPAGFLLAKLRDGIASLGDAGLAHDLAAGRLTPRPQIIRDLPGFNDRQREALESCLAPRGVRLVWGPPGTGKTMVLSEAISELMAAGRRVLLVSATNIAVDNALLNVVRRHRHQPGELLRVGTPHHPEILQHPDVCLPNLVRDQLREIEQRQRAVEERLLELRQMDDELRSLQEATARYDPTEYRKAKQLIARRAAIPQLAAAVASADAAAQNSLQRADLARMEVTAAERQVEQLAESRICYAEIDRLQQELKDLAVAADHLGAQAVTARHGADQSEEELRQQGSRTVLARVSSKGKRRRAARDEALQRAMDLERRARDAGALLLRRQSQAETEVQRLAARTAGSRADIDAADVALASATQRRAHADAVELQAEQDLAAKRQTLLTAEALPEPSEAQRALVGDAERHDWPALAARATTLRGRIDAAGPERRRLEAEYGAVQDQFERLRKDAEGEIIRRARVVAATLARLRTSKPLMDGPYDVVLVDEVGAANLPEVLLAVSRAQLAAVLLGDFLQLGAITNNAVKDAKRIDVERWLRQDVFRHCGISTVRDAEAHQGCTVLDEQHRFGPEIMRLANAIAYEGLLKPGPNVRSHVDDDPEIVLIDTDDLGDIARVRPASRFAGWWPAGALLSRVIADYHQGRGERTGIIAPYNRQADATLEALRDREASTSTVTEVGTVHRFQGREFEVVVFDLVEDEFDRRWMAGASAQGDQFQRDGVRLFTVAITRPRTRLYLVGSQKNISSAPRGTPLAQIAGMIGNGRARVVRATELITPTSVVTADLPDLSPFGSDLAEVLAEHVQVADIDDERSFYEVFSEYLNQARYSIWIWAPWTSKRVRQLLPALIDAVGRGVRVTLFVRDPGDQFQGRPDYQRYLTDLRSAVHAVVEINVMHQKIVVVDEQAVLLGSLNVLSQSRTREVMLVMRGGHFARRLLDHERAEDFAAPPRCANCNGTMIDLRRSKKGDWYWRCYNRSCPSRAAGTRSAWTQPVVSKKQGQRSNRQRRTQ